MTNHHLELLTRVATDLALQPSPLIPEDGFERDPAFRDTLFSFVDAPDGTILDPIRLASLARDNHGYGVPVLELALAIDPFNHKLALRLTEVARGLEAASIGRITLSTPERAFWYLTGTRDFIRCIYGRGDLHRIASEEDDCAIAFEEILTFTPSDNLGVRDHLGVYYALRDDRAKFDAMCKLVCDDEDRFDDEHLEAEANAVPELDGIGETCLFVDFYFRVKAKDYKGAIERLLQINHNNGHFFPLLLGMIPLNTSSPDFGDGVICGAKDEAEQIAGQVEKLVIKYPRLRDILTEIYKDVLEVSPPLHADMHPVERRRPIDTYDNFNLPPVKPLTPTDRKKLENALVANLDPV